MTRWIQNSLIAVLMLPCSILMTQKTDQQQKLDSNPIGIYFGGFGGWIDPYDLTVTQMGTAFFSEDSGGALAVNAKGTAPGKIKGFGGLHIGYEWMNRITPGFRLASALELEGSYFANTAKKADVVNPTDRLDAHDFIDTLPMRVGGLLANGILEFNNDYVSPYIGFGVGVGFVSIHDADSLQIDPLESQFNHFNSDPNDFRVLFATQAKAGLRYRFLKHYRLSAEYRLFYLTSSEFTFGSTVYPTHVPTSPWTVKLSGMLYNAFTLGLDFIF
jgi:opacity protein-like surface antigen